MRNAIRVLGGVIMVSLMAAVGAYAETPRKPISSPAIQTHKPP